MNPNPVGAGGPPPSLSSYDEIPYPSLSFAWTHPNHLATLATLLGMEPPPVERCRVLELGCASGGNLLPMAYCMPDSEFVGLDLSGRQIAEGRSAVEALGIKNLTLRQMNILDVDAGLGQFDFIIAHGVYSWVPPHVQEKLLAICQQNLVSNGIAYVSYNTNPGWRMLGAVRDMMLYHTRHIDDPQTRVQEARALVEFLAGVTPSKTSPHASFLNAYLDFFKDYLIPKNDEFLLHDELEEVNEPIYFYEFAERVARHGLRYLAEAEFHTMLASNLPADVAQKLRQMATNTIEVEQYMDFLRNRAFRQTLLCHAEVQLGGRLTAERLARFHIASSARPEQSEPDIHSAAVEKFVARDGAAISTDHPVTKAALLFLAEIWPRAIPFQTLLTTARQRLNGDAATNPTQDAQVLAANLLKGFGYSEHLIELHRYLPQFVTELSDRPVASPVARWQARRGPMVTNLRHERVELEPVSSHLLQGLDGSRDRAGLLDMLTAQALAGAFEVKEEEQVVTEEAQVNEVLAKALDSGLQQLAKTALLIG